MNVRQTRISFYAAAAVLIVVLAFVVRIWALDVKPPHFDEGVNGTFVDAMRSAPGYHYDARNFHGPLHFYALAASSQIFGRGIWAMRLPTVLVGAASVALLLAFRRFFSPRMVLAAAVAFAISPGMIFYARYAIHEVWLPFFAMLACYGAFGISKGERRMSDLWCVGAGLAGMVLTKETYVMHFVAAVLAWVFVGRSWARHFTRREVVLVGGVCGAVVVALYSGLFYYWRGVAGIFETFYWMAHKGWSSSEEGHHKSLFYYVKLMSIYEWPALIGLALAPLCALRSRCPRVRFLALYGLGSLAAYSLVSYKTPWCVINLLWPFYFLVGYGLDRLATRSDGRLVALLGAVVAIAPVLDAHRINFLDPTDPREPYIYVQQLPDLAELTQPVERLLALDPSQRSMTGIVIYNSPQPLPWALPELPNVGIQDHEKPITVTDADFLIVHESRVAEVEEQLLDVYYRCRFRFYAADENHQLYLRATTFLDVMPSDRVPEFHRRIPLEEKEGR